MIAYVTLGADDIPLAETFYAAFPPRLGYRLEVSSEGLSCTLPPETGQPYGPVDLYIKPPYDQRAGTSPKDRTDTACTDRCKAKNPLGSTVK